MSTTLVARGASRSRDLDAPQWLTVGTFLVPALVIYAGFTAYPVLRTFHDALYRIEPNGGNTFVGLANFVAILGSDGTFWRAVANTLAWAIVEPPIDVALGFTLALALYSRVPFAGLFRIVWFTPVLLSYVVTAVLWIWIYNYDWGVVNQALRFVGLGQFAHVWLGDPKTALPALILTDVWKWAGFNMVVCVAALYSIPREVIEAAELDHCGWFAKTIFVIIPLMRGTLLSLLILSFIGKMKVFDLVWVMTRGGPLWSTETVSTYVYKRAFTWNSFDLGYPSAIAVLWFIVVVSVTLLLTALLRQRGRLEY